MHCGPYVKLKLQHESWRLGRLHGSGFRHQCIAARSASPSHATAPDKRPCTPIADAPHCAAYALGFLDCDNISARCMLSIFQFFATKTDASVLRMLSGSPAERLLKPISEYIEQRGGRIHTRTGCRCAEC